MSEDEIKITNTLPSHIIIPALEEFGEKNKLILDRAVPAFQTSGSPSSAGLWHRRSLLCHLHRLLSSEQLLLACGTTALPQVF